MTDCKIILHGGLIDGTGREPVDDSALLTGC